MFVYLFLMNGMQRKVSRRCSLLTPIISGLYGAPTLRSESSIFHSGMIWAEMRCLS